MPISKGLWEERIMHSYSIGGDKSKLRRNIVLWLFCISIVFYTLEMKLVDWLTTSFPTVLASVNDFLSQWAWLSISLGGLSAFAIFGVLYWLFDKCIWKLKCIRRIIGIPNFSGTWEGFQKTSYDDTIEIRVSMKIEQSWNEISVITTFPESESWSDSAHIEVSHSRGPLLKFTYANRADNPSWDAKEHRGENEMFLQDHDEKTNQYSVLRGDYYNNRGKSGNVGSIILKRKV